MTNAFSSSDCVVQTGSEETMSARLASESVPFETLILEKPGARHASSKAPDKIQALLADLSIL